MRAQRNTGDELNGLLNRLSDERLSENQRRRLNEILRRGGDESLGQYVAFMDLHAALVWDAAEPTNRCAESRVDRRIETSAGNSRFHPKQPEPPGHVSGDSRNLPETSILGGSPRIGFLGRCVKQVRDVFTHSIPLSLLAATFAVASVLLILRLSIVAPAPIAEPPPRDSSPLPSEEQPALVGHVTHVLRPKWRDAAAVRVPGTPLLEGETLDLVEGQIEISLKNDVRIALESPVTFRLDTERGGFLSHGALSVLLPTTARSGRPTATTVDRFTIRAPTLDVVDLGTEFGVKVDRQQTTDIHVYDGAIEVVPKDGDGAATGRQIVLHAGQSLRVEASGKTNVIELKEDLSVRAGEVGLPDDHRRWLHYSKKLRRDPTLVAYYAFEPRAQAVGTLANRASATARRFDGILGDGTNPSTRPTWATGRWRAKTALRFRSDRKQRVVIRDWHDTGIRNAMTFCAWFRSARDTGHMILASQWDSRPTYFFTLALRDKFDEYRGRGLPIRLRVSEDGQAEGDEGISKSEAKSATFTTTSQGWVHVAFTIAAAGGQIRLYKNGREIDTGNLVFHPDRFEHVDQPLVLGAYSNQRHTFFDGWIDEMAVFRRVLTGEEIDAMYQAGRPDGVIAAGARTGE